LGTKATAASKVDFVFIATSAATGTTTTGVGAAGTDSMDERLMAAAFCLFSDGGGVASAGLGGVAGAVFLLIMLILSTGSISTIEFFIEPFKAWIALEPKVDLERRCGTTKLVDDRRAENIFLVGRMKLMR